MSHPIAHEETSGMSLKPQPRPRRTFDLGAQSTPSSAPSSPPAEPSAGLQVPDNYTDGSTTPAKTKSILNLTSSTLLGIYSPTGYAADRDEPSTPWGTGAQTPTLSRTGSMDVSRTDIPNTVLQKGPNGTQRRRRSTITPQTFLQRPKKRGFKGYLLPLIGRTASLFAIGVLYGLLISHLHDKRDMAPVRVDGIDHSSWFYVAFWGVAGVALGQALPWIDCFWAENNGDVDWEVIDDNNGREKSGGIVRGTGGWNDVVRSVGAFVGIAFAIRKLPWQSTLQLSLTLALANPAVWYLIDRSPPGFLLSAGVALGGTALCLGINPALVPSPGPADASRGNVATSLGGEELVLGLFSHESVGVATWIASVLFVSSVCFGNIGRRLAPQKG